jgi:hypothetical protein
MLVMNKATTTNRRPGKRPSEVKEIVTAEQERNATQHSSLQQQQQQQQHHHGRANGRGPQ